VGAIHQTLDSRLRGNDAVKESLNGKFNYSNSDYPLCDSCFFGSQKYWQPENKALGMAWHGRARLGTVRYGMAWQGMARAVGGDLLPTLQNNDLGDCFWNDVLTNGLNWNN
jgi:hypothetical protein